MIVKRALVLVFLAILWLGSLAWLLSYGASWVTSLILALGALAAVLTYNAPR